MNINFWIFLCSFWSLIFPNCVFQGIVGPVSDGSSVSDSPTPSPNPSPTPTHPNNSEDTQSVQKKEQDFDVSHKWNQSMYHSAS